jgi:hypothetical protein
MLALLVVSSSAMVCGCSCGTACGASTWHTRQYPAVARDAASTWGVRSTQGWQGHIIASGAGLALLWGGTCGAGRAAVTPRSGPPFSVPALLSSLWKQSVACACSQTFLFVYDCIP